MSTEEALLASWDRQCQCLHNLLTLVTSDSLSWKASEDGWPIAGHLAHIHQTRAYWFRRSSGEGMADFESLYVPLVEEPGDRDEDWGFVMDLAKIEAELRKSERAVREYIVRSLEEGTQSAGHYDHPVLYLQHMVWHEGYHFGLLMLALRNGGVEPTDEQECALIWDLWRKPD